MNQFQRSWHRTKVNCLKHDNSCNESDVIKHCAMYTNAVSLCLIPRMDVNVLIVRFLDMSDTPM